MTKKMRWIVVISYTLFIYITLPIMRPILNYLKGLLGDGFSISVYILFIFFGIFLFVYLCLIKKDTSIWDYIWLVIIAIVCVYLIIPLKFPEERVHFLEYGLLGYLLYDAIQDDLKAIPLYIATPFIVFLIGSIDEGIQWILPNRVFDIRDILMNGIGGILGLIVTRFVIK